MKRIALALLIALASTAPGAAQTQVNPCNVRAPLKTLGFQALTVAGAAVTLTVPTGAVMGVGVVSTNAINYRTDGTAPTASVGVPVASASVLILCQNQLAPFQAIAQGSTATLNMEFYGY